MKHVKFLSAKILGAKLSLIILCVVWLGFCQSHAKAQQLPQKDLSEYVWDLSYIFPSDDAWSDELKRTREDAKTIDRVRGTMGKSAKELADAMNRIYDLRSRGAKLQIYGALRSDVDTKNEAATQMATVGRSIEREVEAAVGFLPYEINRIGELKLRQWLQKEPLLARHTRRINRILQEAPYTSSPEVQALIESMRGWPGVSAEGFFAFWESDLKWPTYTSEEGNEIQIQYANYRSARRTASAMDRLNVQKTFLGFARPYENILGYLYAQRIEADVTIASHRKFDDAIDAIWYLRDGVPDGTYKTMINTGKKNKELLNRYSSVMSKSIGVQKFAYQDFYANPKGFTRTFPIQEAFEIILGALEPLGSEFVKKVKIQIDKPTMHLVPLPDKRTFYANQMPIAGMPSYTMLSYRGTIVDLRALMGAVAQKVRFADMPAENCPDTRDDPPIYGNSTLYIAEMMLTDYLIEHAGSKNEKLFYLYYALQRLWQHNFHHVVNAELDAKIQSMIMSDNPPSGEQISAIYLQLLKDWYADIEVDPVFGYEWMTNSVPFLSYEGQFWTASMAAACIVYQRMKAGDAQAKSVMLESLMGKGETDLSYTMYKTVGIDLAKEQTYQAMYDRMNSLLDQMEEIEKQ